MLLNSLVLPNGIWQMQLFQINQSEDSSKITIMYDNPSGQLHQRSITSAFNYNRTYSMYLFRLASITMRLVCSMFVKGITFLDVECVTAVQVFPHCTFLHSFIPPFYEGERKKNGLILMKSSTARSVRTIF